MKTITAMKRLGSFLGAGTVALFLLTGCGGGGSSDAESPEARLPGLWRVTRLEARGQSTACPGEIRFSEDGSEAASCGANDSITFATNGSFSASTEEDGTFSGTWRYSNNVLTYTVTTPSDDARTFSQSLRFVDENTLVTEDEAGDLTLTRQSTP
jgi:hypothetical protein